MLRKQIILAAIEVSFDYQRRILRGIRQFALQRPRWEVQLCSYDGHLPDHLRSMGEVSGIIGFFRGGTDNENDLERARSLCGDRVVGVSGWNRELRLPRVIADDERIGEMAAGFFLKRGFRHFFYVGDSGRPPHGSSFERGAAFRNKVTAAGYRVCEVLPDHVFSESFRPELPCAVFAFNDISARLCVEAFVRRGLSVPEDIAVLGADNDPFEGELSRVSLSSIVLNAEGVGYEAARVLDEVIRGKAVPCEIVRRVAPLRIEERASTDVFVTDNPFLRKALRLIKEEIAQLQTVDDVAGLVGASRRVLEKGFRRHLGTSIYTLMQEARVNYSKRLLLETDLSITEISATAGFRDPRMLSVIFRRLTGETPRAFRKRLQPEGAPHTE